MQPHKNALTSGYRATVRWGLDVRGVFPENRKAVSAFVGKESCMPVCQECESVLDFDPDEVEEGDIVVCDECGTEFEGVATEPLELSQVDEEGYEDDDEEVADEEEE